MKLDANPTILAIKHQRLVLGDMKVKLFIFLLVGLLVVKEGTAQNTLSPEESKSRTSQTRSFKSEKKGIFSFLKKNKKAELKTAQEESIDFRNRVSKAYKENTKTEIKAEKQQRKEAKKGEKYFGHKRPPKKRPPHKQKFCKTCKIKH